jgi:hypothetical protein
MKQKNESCNKIGEARVFVIDHKVPKDTKLKT